MVLIPAALIYLMTQPLEILESEEFLQTWGKAYEDVKFYNKKNMLNRLLFCLRRLLFVYSIYQLYEYTIFQILILFYTNLFMTIYQGQLKPLQGRKNNKIQLFNEYMISTISYFLVLYTEMVNSSADKYFYGWIQIGLISTCFAINLVLIIWVLFNQLRFIYIKIRFYCQKAKRFLW